jgi:hypothetical protein
MDAGALWRHVRAGVDVTWEWRENERVRSSSDIQTAMYIRTLTNHIEIGIEWYLLSTMHRIETTNRLLHVYTRRGEGIERWHARRQIGC